MKLDWDADGLGWWNGMKTHGMKTDWDEVEVYCDRSCMGYIR